MSQEAVGDRGTVVTESNNAGETSNAELRCITKNGSGDNVSSISPSLGASPEVVKTSCDDTHSKGGINFNGTAETNGTVSDTTVPTIGGLMSDSTVEGSGVEKPVPDPASKTDQAVPETDSSPAAADNDSAAAIADSVKEKDVEDECLKDEPELDDGWLDILGSGQLKKKVLTAGKDGSRPPQGSLVTVKITGHLQDGTCIQESEGTYILGDGDVIPALEMAVALMNNGEVAEVVTEARFAYGAKGRSPDIPGDSRLNFHLELLNVQPGPDLGKMSAEECLKFGEMKRERGNELFGREDYSGAINSYSKAVQFLEKRGGGFTEDSSILQKLFDCKIKCYNNMAASQLKVGAPEAAIRSCEEVLQTQPDNIKALYRLGKAYSAKGHTQKAMVPLKKALKLDPESKLLHRELAWLTKQQKREEETEKSMYRRMMGSMADTAGKSKNKKSNNNILKWTLLAGGIGVAALSVGLAYYRFGH